MATFAAILLDEMAMQVIVFDVLELKLSINFKCVTPDGNWMILIIFLVCDACNQMVDRIKSLSVRINDRDKICVPFTTAWRYNHR